MSDLKSLKKILIDDLRLETWHKGSYIVLRTITLPYLIVGLSTIVEDETGQVVMLSLYNFVKDLSDNPDLYLPKDSVLLIKEPYFKLGVNGAIMIRCDSPTDVVSINYKDENYNAFNIESINDWGYALRATDRLYAHPTPTCTAEWKSRGNELYTKGNYKDAIRAYSIGIDSVKVSEGEENDLKLIMILNRSGAYLTIKRFDDAVKDATFVLEYKPDNVKALQRASRYLYNLRLFDKALIHYEKLANIDGSNENELSKCKQRIKEKNTGDYNWKDLVAADSKYPSIGIRHDVADYLNTDSIEIRYISEQKGRGVFAKCDIAPGTLLVVSKAFSAFFQNEKSGEILMGVYLKRKIMSTDNQMRNMIYVIQEMLKNPSLSESIYQLWSGPDIKPIKKDEIGFIDADRIYSICSFNSFGIHKLPNMKNTDEKRHDIGCGLWAPCSLFNHACASNASYLCLGDLMVIVSSKFIKADEEITIPYIPPNLDLEERKERMIKYGFNCECGLCKAQSNFEKSKFLRLEKEFKEKISPRGRQSDNRAIPLLQQNIQSIKDIYNKNGQTKFLLKLLPPMTALSAIYQRKGRLQDSINVGIELFELFSNITDVDDYLNGSGVNQDFFVSEELFMIVQGLLDTYERLGDTIPNKWVKLYHAMKKIFEPFQK